MKTKKTALKISVAALMVLPGFGCDKSNQSFSLLQASQTFQQSAASVTNQKIDILWVVDNSLSMDPFQANLVANFNSFISSFVVNGYDFHLAVTTTEAYKSEAFFKNDANYSALRDGVYSPGGTSTHSGYPIIDKNTPNIASTFVFNANQGQTGSGDERAFSSMMDAFNDPQNSGFRRPGAFLAIIILSDEDDFSDPTRPEGSWVLSPPGIPDHDYANASLVTEASYLSQLDAMTNSTSPTNRNYSISAISVLDPVCLANHTAQEKADPATGFNSTTIIGQRYIDLANQTGGVLGDICSTSYSSVLQQIEQKILELSTAFPLSRQPQVSSIQVIVNSIIIPNDATNGWTYNSANNSIVFHGTDIPVQGASIQVNFNPVAPSN